MSNSRKSGTGNGVLLMVPFLLRDELFWTLFQHLYDSFHGHAARAFD